VVYLIHNCQCATCEGSRPAPKGSYGGTLCNCSCHDKPKRGEVYADHIGIVRVMTVADGYVMARRPRAYPFVRSVKDFNREFLYRSAPPTPNKER
jgi:hypothetical protein